MHLMECFDLVAVRDSKCSEGRQAHIVVKEAVRIGVAKTQRDCTANTT